MKQINAYKCEHCGKIYQKINAIEFHEKTCNKNPENKRACFGCVHLVKKVDYMYSHNGEKGSGLFCEHHKEFVHTAKTEIKGNAIEFGNYDNNPMPKECDNLKYPWDEEFLNFESTN